MSDTLTFEPPASGGPVEAIIILRADAPEGPYVRVASLELGTGSFVHPVSATGRAYYSAYATGPGGVGAANGPVSNEHVSMASSVPTEGHTLRASNGEIALTIPPGAYSEMTTVTVEEIAPSASGPFISLAGVYEIGPSGPLGAPATLAIAYELRVTQPQIVDVLLGAAGIATLDSATANWVRVADSHLDGEYLVGQLNHFSPYTEQTYQPHGTSGLAISFCSGVCHDLSDSSNAEIRYDARNRQVCYFCHGQEPYTAGPAGATGSNIEAEFFEVFEQPQPTVKTMHPVDAGLNCSNCHDPHKDPYANPDLLRSYDAITGKPVTGGNAFCWTCHGTTRNRRISFSIQTINPLRDYYLNSGGDHRTGYVLSAHSMVSTPSGISCLGCHSEHGAPRGKLLNARLSASTSAAEAATDRDAGAYAQACLQCHDGGAQLVEGAANIKQYVTYGAADTGILAGAGHRVKSDGGDLPVDAPLPCTSCHGPHGSNRGNLYLLSDALVGDFDASAVSVRRFCLSCHVTSELLGWNSTSAAYVAVSGTDEVAGLPRDGGAYGSGPSGQGYNWLRLKVTAGHAAADSQSCYECHGNDYTTAASANVHAPAVYPIWKHLAAPASASVTIQGVAYGPVTCSSCHAYDLYTEHDKASASSASADCVACHPTPRSSLVTWGQGCAQGNCHAGTSPDPMHGTIDAAHNAPTVSCTQASCHNASIGLAALHVDGKRSVAGQVRTSCALCHADGVPATADCSTCHGYTEHPAHTVSGPCIGSNCHSSDAIAIHNASASKCQACHAPSKTKSFSCGACHTSPHPNQVGVLYHGGAGDLCVSCHSTGNVKGIHGDKCMTCHSVAVSPYTGSCSQTGCHVASSIHTGIPGWYDGHHTDHGEGPDCWDCHSHSECLPCHQNVYERALPVTTSNARASYTAAAVINLSAVDQGQSGVTSGIAATYYQVDGGPIQQGTSIFVLGPDSGSKSHSIEFWSVDNNRNIEAHHTAYFDVVAGTDTSAPTGTMAVNNGAAYTNSTWCTLNNTVTDAGTGVASVRIDPGTGTFGQWQDWSAAPAFQLTGDGPKTIIAEFRDGFGNTLSLMDTITLDTVRPTGNFTINNGATATNSLNATVNSNISDANGVAYMRFYNSGSSWSAWEPYNAAKAWTLGGNPAVNGSRTVYAQYSDPAGNIFQPAYRTITYDITLPTGTMNINSEAPFTGAPGVMIYSAVSDTPSGMGQMRFSNDGTNWSAWETYAATKNWTLLEGEGSRIVYAEYRDRAGNVLALSDSITLGQSTDMTPPTGTVSINAGAAWTNNLSVTLTLSATDNEGGLGVYDMSFSNDNITWSAWRAYATTTTWSMAYETGTPGPRTVYVRFRDGGSNVSDGTISDSIGWENTRPTGTVLIDGGNAYTASQTVSLTLSATDVGGSGLTEMSFSNNNSTWSAWEPYATSKSWTLTDGAAIKYVYARYRDAAGNVSLSANDTIAYLLQYTLTYTAGPNGALSGTSPQTIVYMGSGSPVTALPDTGYRFLGWSDGSESNPRTDVNVTESKTHTAYFGANGTHTVRFVTDGYGYVSGQWIQAVPNGASTVSVTAVSYDTSYFTWMYWYNYATGEFKYDPTITLTNVTGDQTWTACFYVSGTCPFLYTWDGDSYEFEADEFAAGYLGLRTSKGYRKPNPLDYHVLKTTPAVKDGALEYKLVEERHETDYIDQAELYTIDAPADRDVYVERSQAEGVGLFTTLDAVIHTVARDLQPPPSVTWINTGQDVRELVSTSDKRYVVLNENRNANYNYQTLELDLGDVQDAPMVKLVIDGRTMVPTSPEGRAYSRTFGAQVKFEVQDAAGNWVAVPATTQILPKPPEFDRPFVMNLSNIWISESRKVRFTYLYKTYIDSILLDTTADVPVTITELPLLSADLQPHGFNQHVGLGELYDYVYGAAVAEPRYRLPGNYTRFGDVTPLLTEIDDMFAIFGGGDEITLRFAPPSTSAEGMTRRYLFLSDGYYKSLKEDISKTVDPLPFAAMSNFPYPDTESYPTDAAHQAYISEYNTRYESDTP
jgi:hypothetical protein